MSLSRAPFQATCRAFLLALVVLFLVAPQPLQAASRSENDEDPTPVPTGTVQAARLTSVSKSKLKSGTAFQFGLEPGDLIYAINGKRISSAEDLQAYIKGEHSWGEVARVSYLRGSQAYEITDLPFLVQGGFIRSHASLLWSGDFETATIEVPASAAQNAIVRQQRGIFLKTVTPGQLADKAALKAGDVILAVRNKLVNNPGNLPAILYEKRSSEPVPILYLRDGKKLQTEISGALILKYRMGMKGESQIVTLSAENVVAASQQTSPSESKAAVSAQPSAPATTATAASATPQATPTAAIPTKPDTPGVVTAEGIPVAINVKGWPVIEVAPDGPAAKAGLRAGDHITHLNGLTVNDNASLAAVLPNFQPRQGVDIALFRGNQHLVLSAVLQTINGANYLGVKASPAAEKSLAGIPWPVVPKPELAPGLEYSGLQSSLLPAWNLYQSVIQARPVRTINTTIRWKHGWVADGDVPCSGAPVDIVYFGAGTSFANFVRLSAPTCSGARITSPGLVVENSGRVMVGQISMVRGNLLPSYSLQLDAQANGALLYRNGQDIVARQDSFGNLVLAKPGAQPIGLGTTLAYLSLKNLGYFDLEASYISYDLAKTKLFHGDGYTITADAFKTYYRKTEDEPVTNFDNSFIVIKATGQQRWDTKKPTAAGPAGTYYIGGLRPIHTISEMIPAPGTLAQYARDVAKCPYKPAVPEGFLHWAGTCTPDYIAAYSIDGQFGLFFDKGKGVTIAGLDPDKPGIVDRTWTSANITNTNPPLPIGKTDVFDARHQLVFRGNLRGYNPEGEGECPVPNSKDFEPCTWKDGRRTDIAFLARERQRQLDAVAARQQQQALASMASAQQQRNDEAARQAELNRIAEQERRAEEAAERREEEARNQARWAETFANISNTFAQSQAEVAANQRRAEHLRAQQQAAAQARSQQEQQDRETAYRRQQVQNINAATARQEAIANQNAQKRAAEQQAANQPAESDAMARALAAQRAGSQQTTSAQPGTRTPVNTRVPSAQPTAPTNTQRAPQSSQGTTIAKATTAAQAKMDPCISDARDFCMPDNSKPSKTKTAIATPPKPETAPAKKENGVVNWPEGIVVCTQLKKGMKCSGPFTTTGDSVDQACGGDGTRHNYGTQQGFIVWGCGFGIDSPGKNDSFHQQNHRDMASRYGLNLPSRRTYGCPAGQVNPTYCYHER